MPYHQLDQTSHTFVGMIGLPCLHYCRVSIHSSLIRITNTNPYHPYHPAIPSVAATAAIATVAAPPSHFIISNSHDLCVHLDLSSMHASLVDDSKCKIGGRPPFVTMDNGGVPMVGAKDWPSYNGRDMFRLHELSNLHHVRLFEPA
jgi:hypothetical protein